MNSYYKACSGDYVISSFNRAGYYIEFEHDCVWVMFNEHYAHRICDELGIEKKERPLLENTTTNIARE